MLIVRQIHAYLAIFIAPSVLFFALTGALQLFSLHEAHAGYSPPAVIERLGRLHKDQVFATHPDRGPPPQASGPARRAQDHGGHDHGGDRPKASTVILKWFFLFVALGLVTSTSLGLWIGLKQNRRKRLAWLLLAAGTAIPVGVLLI